MGTSDGAFTGDSEAPSGETTWKIVPQADGTWALVSAAGYYAHGTGSKLSCFAKERDPLPADGKWVVHLAMHPQ